MIIVLCSGDVSHVFMGFVVLSSDVNCWVNFGSFFAIY